MKKALIVIDMQNDFLFGTLANPDAAALVDGTVNEILSFDGDVFATRDTHGEDYLTTPEGQKLPVTHCVKNTDGWQIQKDISLALEKRNAILLDKPTFGYLGWGFLGEYDEVTLIGTCTDICVVSNALILKAMLPALCVKVLSKLCAGTSPENHNAALTTMRCCQVEVLE